MTAKGKAVNGSLHNVADLERIDALADDLATAIRRIAELEAEVERLKARKEMIVELWSAGLDIDLSRQLQEWDAEDERGVNPSGDTLGGGGRESGIQPIGSPAGIAAMHSAAAEPAAPCGHHHYPKGQPFQRCSRCGHFRSRKAEREAARKERDG